MLAVASFVLAWEEISWGQRILGFETPDEIEQINAQQETNLHNMFVGYNQLIRLAIALVIATDRRRRPVPRFDVGTRMPEEPDRAQVQQRRPRGLPDLGGEDLALGGRDCPRRWR